MQTNWKVWILSIVAAVGGANIIGVNEPVRAQEVTYTIGSAQLSSGWDVTGGSIEYSNGGIEGGSLSMEDVADSRAI